MTGNASLLEDCLLPLSRRTPSVTRFYRVIGYDRQETILTELKQIYALTNRGGIYLQNGLSNPTEPEIQRFFREVGESFTLTRALVSRHLTVWLGQLRPTQRTILDNAIAEILDILKGQGANDNIRRNICVGFAALLVAFSKESDRMSHQRYSMRGPSAGMNCCFYNFCTERAAT